MNNHRVLFYQVKQPHAKLERLIDVATDHFERKAPLLIFVEDQKSAEFVDKTLWSSPEMSFLPHTVASNATKERIVITTGRENLNEATSVFNLTKGPIELGGTLTTLYEFEDLTSEQKSLDSKNRYHHYKNLGYALASL